MQILAQECEGIVIHDIPNDKIDDWVNFSVLPFEHLSQVKVYKRPKEECPFNRGNWVCDIIFDDGKIIVIKLPLKMTQEQVDVFCEPLLKRWKN